MIPFSLMNNNIRGTITYDSPASGMSMWHKVDADSATTDTDGKNTLNGFTMSRLWDFSGNGYHAQKDHPTELDAPGMYYLSSKTTNSKPAITSTAALYRLYIPNWDTNGNSLTASKHTTFSIITTKSTTESGVLQLPRIMKGGVRTNSAPNWNDQSVGFFVYRDTTDTSKSMIDMLPNGYAGSVFTRDGLTGSTTYLAISRCIATSSSFLSLGSYSVSVSGMNYNSGRSDDSDNLPSFYGTVPSVPTPSHGFSEFIHYDYLLSDAEFTQTVNYLKNKYNLTF